MTDLELLDSLLSAAKRAGAEAADALFLRSDSLSVQRRLGKVEQVERSESRDIGLRVFLGRRQAIVSTTDTAGEGFAALAERAVAMARAVPEDPFAGLPEAPPASLPAFPEPAREEPSTEALLARAAAAEEAALAVPGVTNSEGASAAWGITEVALAASTGFAGRYARASHSVSVTAVAGQGTAMERDYEWHSATTLAALEDPAALGRRAGEQAVRRLNPRRPETRRLPVVYAPRVAASLLMHFAQAANGAAVARGTSFLAQKRGERVFAPGIRIRDDALRPGGLRSRPFDLEGTASAPLDLVADGVLVAFVLDCRSARQLGLASTGHASRGVSSPPSPAVSNLWLEPGARSPEELLRGVGEGLYVTELIGMGVNMVTGDYSRGAAGFLIRGGELAEPVSGITIAGRLPEMFAHLTPANDLAFRRGVDAPTVLVEGLTMAGRSGG
ncbi:MAG: TldD/PmbA family protein [Acetobacteraceae bacterium]|nr:TldD/PmbA family protein [Acetobacteraceae bacterium]MDW8397958.1 TldD/PmbA family protein [Acetobacteraceae bacterium]